MSGDSFSSKGRSVLGDVTNLPLKRGLSLIIDDADSKSRDTKGKSRVLRDMDSDFTEHVSPGVENLLGEKLAVNDKGVGVEKIVSFLKERRGPDTSSLTFDAQTAQNEQIHSISDIKHDAKAPNSSMPNLSLEGLDTIMSDDMVQVGDKECQGGRVTHVVPGGSIPHALRHADKDLGVGKLASDKFGSIEWSRLPTCSQGRSFELGKCKLLKDSDTNNTCHGSDQLSGCSCSFCLKAAYIWSDLHYQDIKGQIATLRKTQKEASALAQKISEGKDMVADHNPSRPSELESNLLNQWRSLFLHMEAVLGQEGNQLDLVLILAASQLHGPERLERELQNGSRGDQQDAPEQRLAGSMTLLAIMRAFDFSFFPFLSEGFCNCEHSLGKW